jgi:hypothetical protein
MKMRWTTWLLVASMSWLASCDGGSEAPVQDVTVRVTITNVSAPGALTTDAGDALDIVLSPGAWAVHTEDAGLFAEGEPASPGLEALAEGGDSTTLLAEIADDPAFFRTGTFGAQHVGENYEENPFLPGESVSFDVHGRTDTVLSLAAMFIHSNDMLVATDPAGIALDLPMDEPTDSTTELGLWDAGTEVDEPPGSGPTQPMQGPGGTDEGGVVHRVEGTDEDGHTWPATEIFIEIILERTR